jgi:protein-S-isoprenylcysteine O-methyltransferase Ste14
MLAHMASGVSFSERGGWWVVAQALLLVVALVLPIWTAGTDGPFGEVLRAGGLPLVALGLLVALAGLATLGRALTPFPRPRERGELVVRGVYRFVRHPVYVGLVVAAFGWALAHLSAAGVVYCALLGVFFDRKARREERWLRERYPEYADYARRVRRFIPGIY